MSCFGCESLENQFLTIGAQRKYRTSIPSNIEAKVYRHLSQILDCPTIMTGAD